MKDVQSRAQLEPELKKCSGPCGQRLPISEFHKAGTGRQGKCKACWSQYQKDWRRQNPLKRREQWKRSAAKIQSGRRINPDHYRKLDRAYCLKNKYGITPEQYDQILQWQDGACALCPKKTNGKRRFAVDHNHTTGVVRGLLCDVCNMTVTKVETVPDWATKASIYLETESVWDKMKKS